MSTPFYFLLFLFLFFNSHTHANHSPPCPTTQFSCGSFTGTIEYPFFTNTTTSDPQCQNLHLIQCLSQRTMVQFNGTGFLYVVRNISYFDRTILVDDPNFYSSTWNSNCTFLYSFKNPSHINNLSQLTLHINATFSSFSCSRLENDYYPLLFGNFLGPLSCKNYTLFFSQMLEDQHQQSHLPAYCWLTWDRQFSWKLSFGGDHKDKNNGDGISVLSGGFSDNWDFLPDCFSCLVSADNGCITSAGGRDPNHSCGCTKQCHVKAAVAGRKKMEKWIVIGVIVGLSSFFLLALFFFMYLLRKRHNDLLHFSKKRLFPSKKKKTKRLENEQRVEAILQNYEHRAPKRYNYSEVKKIAKDFKSTVGKGGFGAVFKGKLSDGQEVAVKVLYESKGEGEDFLTEILSISRTSHVNVVTLLGFCFEGSNRALIYEFMPNGTLADFIYEDKSNMEASVRWEKLHDIAVGIGRGLEYLHHGCNTRIVHFDIKPHNILLDKQFRPKIADFGLAKLCSTKKSALSVQGTRGTPGYIAPEFCFPNFGAISSKADVYSYGMMVLQMVKGRNNICAGVENSSENCSAYCIYNHLTKYDNLGAIGVTLEAEEVAKKLILVGLWCIQIIPADRPSMTRVVEMLEGSIECLQMPPCPKLF